MVEFVFFPLVDRRRPGADKAHLSDQHVKELGELIQARLADEFADARLFRAVRQDLVADDARVKVQLEHHAVFDAVLLHELLLALLRIHVHGADLEDLELLAVLADPGLLEEDRAGALFFDDRAHNDDDQNGQNTAHDTAQDIQHALQQQLQGGRVVDGSGQDRSAAHLLHELLDAVTAHGRDVVMDRDRHCVAVVHQLHDAGIRGRAVDVDRVDPLLADVIRRARKRGDHGDAADFVASALIEDRADELVAFNVVVHQARHHLLGAVRGEDHQHGAPLADRHAVLSNESFPRHAGRVSYDDVEQTSDKQQNSRVVVAHLQHEHVRRCKRQHCDTVPDRPAQLGEIVSLEHIVHRVQEHDDYGVDQRQRDRQVPVDHLRVRQFMVPQQRCQNIGGLQTDQF